MALFEDLSRSFNGRPAGDPVMSDLARYLDDQDKASSLELWRERRFLELKEEYSGDLYDAIGYENQEHDADQLGYKLRIGDLAGAKLRFDAIMDRAATQYAEEKLREEEEAGDMPEPLN